MRIIRKLMVLGLAMLAGGLVLSFDAREAGAHGERTQEPFFRMRTLQWFDVNWSKSEIAVNEDWDLTAKVYVMNDWPSNIPSPDLVFVTALMPGPVMARISSYLNDVPARQSIKGLQHGKVYEYKSTFRGRIPGTWHVHPELSVAGSGVMVGAGKNVTVTGSHVDFLFPLTTMTGETIPDLEMFGLLNVGIWHIIWTLIGAVWLLFWLLRPLLIPRFIALQGGREDLLIRRIDVVAGAVLFTLSLTLIYVSYFMGVTRYPTRVPLQVSVNEILDDVKQPGNDVKVRLDRAEYDVPGRALRIKFRATNTGSTPLTLGEFTSATLRFMNKRSRQAMATVTGSYPKELIPDGGLTIANPAPLQPGETRNMEIAAIDVAWELERLTSFMTDVDARFGGIMFFFGADGSRHLAEIAGPILPVFTAIGGSAAAKSDVEVAAAAQD